MFLEGRGRRYDHGMANGEIHITEDHDKQLRTIYVDTTDDLGNGLTLTGHGVIQAMDEPTISIQFYDEAGEAGPIDWPLLANIGHRPRRH